MLGFAVTPRFVVTRGFVVTPRFAASGRLR
jgi:hypothetical protein